MTLSGWFTRLAVISSTFALDYHVSPRGRDTNSGTSSSPFLTLTKAQIAVRAIVSSTQSEDITIHIADGEYTLSSPLLFTAADSGKNGYKVSWTATGSNSVISGGKKLTGWTLDSKTGIYSTTVPVGTESRHLYVGGSAAQYARTKLDRKSFKFDNDSMSWTSAANDWLSTIPGIENAEIRAINSFTDRYSPVKSASSGRLIMDQPAWKNNVWGWDHIADPFHEGGFYIQNALSLLTDGNEYFLDSAAGKIYYKPLAGQDMATIDTYLGHLETLVAIGGTLDAPAHDISFKGLNFAHTTWNYPTVNGLVDQQTGGYIGDFNRTYPIFEATRPHWYQMPSAIQISAAKNISFTGGKYTQLGSGAFGIGNDENAHITKVGLGAQDIAVKDGYFTQVMGNSLTLGGIQADAHHPSDSRMTNTRIVVSGNIFYNTSSIFSSTVPIFGTYLSYSEISNNDMSFIPYSGICYGYGWGTNDVGGNPEYAKRGLYAYQPIYDIPTISMNVSIKGNLIHDFGLAHTDLGGIYTLSKSPGTVIENNYDYASEFLGYYADEGTNSLLIQNNVFFPNNWHWANASPDRQTTGKNVLLDNFGARGYDLDNKPNGSGDYGNTWLRNYVIGFNILDATALGQRVAYRAGISPSQRAGRKVSNPTLANSHIGLTFPVDMSSGVLTATISNFEDVDFTDVSLSPSLSSGFTLTPVSQPSSIPKNSFAVATWKVTGSGCTPPLFSLKVSYSVGDSATKQTISTSGTMPGTRSGLINWKKSSSWPAQFASNQANDCVNIGITTSGRDIGAPNDDWAAVYTPAYIKNNGHISVHVNTQDPVNVWTKSGVVVRNSLANKSRSAGYAVLVVTPSEGVSMMWDSNGAGILNQYRIATGVKAPVFLKITVSGNTAIGAYSTDEKTWVQVGPNVELFGRNATLDVGMIHTSHAAFRNSTAMFSKFNTKNTA